MLGAEQIVSTAATGGFWDIAANCGYALIVSSIVLTFMYLWAVLWRNQQMVGTVKLEITELFVSAILVSFVVGLVGALSTLAADVFLPQSIIPAGAQGKNIYAISEMYFLEVKTTFVGWMETTYLFAIFSDSFARVTPYTKPLGVGFISSPLAGLGDPIKQLLSNSLLALMIAYLINYAQYLTYLFSLQAFLKYYLPFGLFLRCFTPTRKIGGSIIAVSAALVFVFPVLTVISYAIFFSSDGPIAGFNSFFSPSLLSTTLNDASKTIKETLLKPENLSIWSLVLLPLYVIVAFIKSLFGGLFFVVFAAAGGIIARAFLIGYIMPTFNILMLIQATRGLSKSFGEEIDISSLTRLI